MVGQDVMRCLMALGLVLQGLSFGAQAAPGGAVELYRYVNDKGVVVLDRCACRRSTSARATRSSTTRAG